ncbi:MAG: SGNH/GDSL hydrolase family protein [Planctomycetes bacterium]|nr:SGNH/GDSL hydrolase family protein [Planctomycetota bacterium]
MISLATLAMIGWIPLILVSFSLLSPRRAVVTAYIVGWMFLPILSWNLPGLPAYDKTTATNLGVFFGVLLFDTRRLASFRPSAIDLPLIVFCLSPLGTSLANDLGIYDGLAGVWAQVIAWVMPWVIGRCYFATLPDLRELAIGMFLGAVAYIPLCLFEMAFGAILHLKIYGYYQHAPDQTVRADGSVRPMVFMQHGLMLAMWMGSSSLVGLAVARDAGLRRIPPSAKSALAFALVATTILSRSVGASVLLLLGMLLWYVARSVRFTLPIAVLAFLVPSYMALRWTGAVEVADLTQPIASVLQASGVSQAEATERLRSARVRFESEDWLLAEARTKPVFGLSAWGFNQTRDRETGEMISITTDGFWTILAATRGLIGLGAWTLMMLLPALLFLRRHPPSAWRTPLVATGGALALVLALTTADCLMNANINPIYTLIGGGMIGLPQLRLRSRPRVQRDAAGVGPGARCFRGLMGDLPSVLRPARRHPRLYSLTRGAFRSLPMQQASGRRTRRITALILGAFLSVGALEFVLRIAAPQPKSWLEIYRSLPEPLYYGFDRARCLADTGDARWQVRIDAEGRRIAAADEQSRTPAAPTIPVIGDSFVFGYGVPFEDSIAGLLAAASAGQARYRDEGVPGYGPIQYRALLERDLAEEPAPARVVVVSYLGNDFFDCVWGKRPTLTNGTLGDTGGARGMLKRHVHVYRLFSRLWHSLGMKGSGEAHLAMFAQQDWTTEPLAHAKTVFEEEFRAMQAACAQRHVPLTVLLIPPIEEVRHAGSAPPGLDFGLPGAQAREVLTNLGVPFVDSTAALTEAGYANTFLQIDGHLSRRGNEIARDCILRAFVAPSA